MEKNVIPDEKVEELFCYETDSEKGYTKSVGVTGSGKYYIVETHEYNVGSAYSHYSDYYPIEPDEVSYYRKVAEGRKKAEELKRSEEESIRLEDQKHLLTNDSDRDFYKKKSSDTIWWVKDETAGHMFSFDKETVYDLMTDYPEKLTPGQKEIFDKENPYWKIYFQKKNKRGDTPGET